MSIRTLRAARIAPLALALFAAQARADTLVADDEIVQGSLCAGEECVLN